MMIDSYPDPWMKRKVSVYCFLFLTALLLLTIPGCQKSVDYLDPSQTIIFTQEPKLTASFAGSMEYSMKVNGRAKILYVTLPAGASAPTVDEIRKGKSSGGGQAVAFGTYYVDSNSTVCAAQFQKTNTPYDVYLLAESTGNYPLIFTKTFKLTASSQSAYSYQTKFSQTSAFGIASDPLGFIYTTSLGGVSVSKYDRNGNPVLSWGSFGSGDGQFNGTMSVACDRYGNVYVADRFNCRVQKFDSNGNFILKWGTTGTGDGQFSDPNGVTVDPTGRFVFVCDGTDDRIQKFTSNGVYLMQWGSTGAGIGQFNQPNQMAVDRYGSIWVADFFNNRVQKFDSNGIILLSVTRANVVSVFADNANGIYYCIGSTWIEKYDTTGNFITTISSFGGGDGQINTIHDMTVDVFGNIWVADSGLDRYQKFR